MLQMKTDVLDHGYVGLVESWGSDERIVESARMSTSKSFEGWAPLCAECKGASGKLIEPAPEGAVCSMCGADDALYTGDERLLRKLYREKHSTPFEFAGLTIEVQAPLMVFREWQRHRVPFGYSELSARYTPMPNLSYVPSLERLVVKADAKNRQAGAMKGSAEVTEQSAEELQRRLAIHYDSAEELYQWALQAGFQKEIARLAVTVGRYSRMRATGNLRGWLNFLGLRAQPTAQWEIRAFASVVAKIVEEEFPRTYALFIEPSEADEAKERLRVARSALERILANPKYSSDEELQSEIKAVLAA